MSLIGVPLHAVWLAEGHQSVTETGCVCHQNILIPQAVKDQHTPTPEERDSQLSHALYQYRITVDPLNKEHFGTSYFVKVYRRVSFVGREIEVVPFSKIGGSTGWYQTLANVYVYCACMHSL